LGAADETGPQVPDPLCDAHGCIGHLVVREASRALAAIETGASFERVSVLPPQPEVLTAHDERLLGGMTLVAPFAQWARTSALEAFEVTCAAALSEQALLGHYLHSYWEQDLRTFRVALGLTAPLTRESLDEVLEEPAGQVAGEVRAWASENAERILAVAWALSRSGSSREPRGEWSRTRSLTEDEVRSILRRHDVTLHS
jgi:hypothetical protein